MCGILGFIDFSGNQSAEKLGDIARLMSKSIKHRGPDDDGIWVDASVGLALGHRRLSILDLSPEGHQPMVSSCGRYVIIFNGEIYNHRLIRNEVERSGIPIDWRGHSDTEVMLAAISIWGVEKALEQFNGMFAVVLWDRKERKLFLFRDRLGEKPLYYGLINNILFFASELKALKVHPQWKGDIDRDALALYLRYGYIPSPYSIYKNIYKLPPANILELPYGQLVQNKNLPEPEPYWSAKTIAETRTTSFLNQDEQGVLTEFDRVLRDAVSLRMEADVPLGAFLSGGFDSSLIVALMQSISSQPVRSFSIGFDVEEYDEARHAKAVAKHLGTNHTELYVSERETMDVIPKLPCLFDEPFADSSQIPTFIVAQLARKDVTVALSGDGGDELFCGYKRYHLFRNLWSNCDRVPVYGRKLMSKVLTAIPGVVWNRSERLFAQSFKEYGRSGKVADKMYKLANILAVENPEQLYQGLISHWHNPLGIVKSALDLPSFFSDENSWLTNTDVTNRVMYFDMVKYLPDDILVKVDRATMGVSLEARVPFLDHRVVEFAWKVPLSMKYRDGSGKWLLRQLLYRYVPQELMDRPKMGFGVPVFKWLRGALQEWAEDLLNETRLEQEGFFDPAPIRQKWKEHLSGERNWQYPLWNILMFQAWYAQWK